MAEVSADNQASAETLEVSQVLEVTTEEVLDKEVLDKEVLAIKEASTAVITGTDSGKEVSATKEVSVVASTEDTEDR